MKPGVRLCRATSNRVCCTKVARIGIRTLATICVAYSRQMNEKQETKIGKEDEEEEEGEEKEEAHNFSYFPIAGK